MKAKPFPHWGILFFFLSILVVSCQRKQTIEGAPPVMTGEKLFQAKGCIACHTLDGKDSTGPSLVGAFGKMRDLSNGSTIQVDEAYLKESIRTPSLKVRKGFSPVMPQLPMKDQEVQLLVEYLKNLK